MTNYKLALIELKEKLSVLDFVMFTAFQSERYSIGNNLDAIIISEGNVTDSEAQTGGRYVLSQEVYVYHITNINNSLETILDRSSTILKTVLNDSTLNNNAYDIIFNGTQVDSNRQGNIENGQIAIGINANLSIRQYSFNIKYCFSKL